MSDTTQTDAQLVTHGEGKAIALALSLAQAERAIQAFASGQIDAIVDPDGKAYLLRAAQEDLRQRVQHLQAVLGGVADVITVVNEGGMILSQNRAARRILGHASDSAVGTSLFRLVHEEDVRDVYSAFFNVREGYLDQAKVRFRHRTRDGSHREIEATLAPLNDGSAPGVIFSLRPTAAPRARIDAAETPLTAISSALLKDRFLAMLSHELRTPLTPALMGVAELQEDERFVEAQPVLDMIRRNLKLQSRLLEDLSDFTAIAQHKVRLRLETIDAHEHIRFVLGICRNEIDAANIAVLLDLRAAEPLVLADSLRFQQVMWNLVKNAIKFSTPGASISIASANEGPGLTLDFVDYGAGIEADLLPLVFAPFQQGSRSMQQLHGGLGLGLFIAKGLAEAQGGTLSAFSEGLGKGATFRLTIGGAHSTPANSSSFARHTTPIQTHSNTSP